MRSWHGSHDLRMKNVRSVNFLLSGCVLFCTSVEAEPLDVGSGCGDEK